jgi:hypothetical protein
MATLEHLATTDKLISHEPDLENGEFPERFIYFAPDFDAWLGQTLAGLDRRHRRNRTPYEQTEQILYNFIIGRRLAYGSGYHPLDPLSANVWELKSPDVRLFGWFPRRRYLVVVCGELKENLRKISDYTPHIRKVVAFRDALDLDEPKTVTGVRQDEVL